MADPYNRDAQLKDFRNLLRLIWKHLGLPEPTDVQCEVAKIIQKGPDKLLITGFRGMGKSYLLGAFCIHQWYWRPKTKILVTSASGNKAEEFAGWVQTLIHEMPEFHFLRPNPEKNHRASVLKFDVGPCTRAQSPSMRAVGITGQTTGGRADIIICDDIEIPENSDTETQREKVKKSALDLPKMLIPEGLQREIYLGTFQTEQSIYLQLPSEGFHPFVIPVRYPKSEKLPSYNMELSEIQKDEDGVILEKKQTIDALAPFVHRWKEKGRVDEWEPLEPTRFDEFFLQKQELRSKSSFMLQFMLDKDLSNEERYPLKLRDLIVMDLERDQAPERPVWGRSDATEIRGLENVGLTGDRFYGPSDVLGSRLPYSSKILAIDPAGRGKDEAAYVVLGELNGYLYVLAWGGLSNVFDEGNLEILVDLAKSYGVHRVIYEKNMGDEMFGKLLQPRLMEAGHGVTFEPIHNSQAKEQRICDVLEPITNSHRLIMDKGVVERDLRVLRQGVDEADQRFCRGLYQFTHITRDRGCLPYDDRIDVLALGASHFQARLAVVADEQMKRRQEEEVYKMLNTNAFGEPLKGPTPPTWGRNKRGSSSSFSFSQRK